MNVDRQTATETVWSLIEDGNCIAWIGSGLSATAGYPSWETTIRQLCIACSIRPPEDNEWTAELLQTKADECKTSAPDRYYDTLANLFGRPNSQTRRAYQQLLKLPFKAFVTTNYDPLLMYAGEMEKHTDIYRYPSLPIHALRSKPSAIIYMHGLARYPDNSGTEVATGKDLILSRSEFDAAYGASSLLPSFLLQLLTYEKVLFLGCRLREPEIQAVLQRMRDLYAVFRVAYGKTAADMAEQLPVKYLLTPSERRELATDVSDHAMPATEDLANMEAQRSEEERLRELYINIVRYDPANQHTEIEEILSQLCYRAEKFEPARVTMGLGKDLPQ